MATECELGLLSARSAISWRRCDWDEEIDFDIYREKIVWDSKSAVAFCDHGATESFIKFKIVCIREYIAFLPGKATLIWWAQAWSVFYF